MPLNMEYALLQQRQNLTASMTVKTPEGLAGLLPELYAKERFRGLLQGNIKAASNAISIV